MSGTVIVAVIGLVGSFALAVFTYWSTKRRDRQAESRKEKLVYYKAFIESLSGVVEGDATPEGHRAYTQATNNLLLFAPQAVLSAVSAYRVQNSISNKDNWSLSEHDRLLSEMLLAIRRDVGVMPADVPATFKPKLWASGASGAT